MEEWKRITLKDATDIIGDGLHGTPVFDSSGEYYFVNGNNLVNGIIDIKSDTKRTSFSEFEKYKKHLTARTLLVSINGTIGNTAKYRGERIVLGKSACDLNIKPEYDLDYIYYVLCSEDFQNSIKGLATGTTIKNVSLKTIREYSFCIPPLERQKHIGHFLRLIDDKIALNNRINHNLEEQAQALYKSWFIDFEPFKGGKFVDSGLGLIPEGWHVGTLSEIADITMGQSPSGSSFNEDGRGIVFYQGRTEFGFRFPSIKLFTTEPTRYAEPHSVLMSVRAPVGDINVALVKCCIGRGLAAITAKYNAYSFVFYTLKGKSSELDLYNGEGTVFGSINRKDLEGLSVLIPPKLIIQRFNDCIKPIDDSIEIACKEIVSLSYSRDSLLPKLMSGQLTFDALDC